mmetsp:Transcript_5887/g.16532  ORF Transcript_5887/g.16532 Transcript_5887/m.16532 type:complete len:108 (-) Transcript_5887:245-568(-)
MEILLQGVDHRTFNFITSVIVEVLQLAASFTLCVFIHLMVSIFLRKGHKIPARAVDPMPNGLIAAIHFAQNMRWAWPATLALFIFISDYSTAIAFVSTFPFEANVIR